MVIGRNIYDRAKSLLFQKIIIISEIIVIWPYAQGQIIIICEFRGLYTPLQTSSPEINKFQQLSQRGSLEQIITSVNSPLKRIYVMYIWGLGGLYTTIQSRQGEFFSSEATNIPEGTALPEGIFLPRTKKIRRGGGYIVVYSPTRPHIYNKYTIFFSLSLIKRIH